MQQLQLIEESATNTSLTLERLLCQPRISWTQALQYADNIEETVDNADVYNCYGYTPRTFLKELGVKGQLYRLAIKAVWWHRLVAKEYSLTWFEQRDIACDGFFSQLNFIEYDRKQHKYTLVKNKLEKARLQWTLVHKKYRNPTKAQLAEYFVRFLIDKPLQESTELLRDRIRELEQNLDEAMAGNLVFYGITSSNQDLSADYIELYCMACRSSMSFIQFKQFIQLLILKNKYIAADYLRQFEIYEEYT